MLKLGLDSQEISRVNSLMNYRLWSLDVQLQEKCGPKVVNLQSFVDGIVFISTRENISLTNLFAFNYCWRNSNNPPTSMFDSRGDK